MAEEFVPGAVGPEGPCTDLPAWGTPSVLVPQYIAKIKVESESTYPSDACTPYYYSKAKIDDFHITNDLDVNGDIDCDGHISAGSFSANSKAFNIPHPSPGKEGIRLLHGCLEGPEYGVYTRGRVTNKKEIVFPPYWKDLIDWTTITISLTPIGSHQDVIVKRFDEEKVYLQSNGGLPIDCFYHVYATRKDVPILEVEQDA